VIAVIHLIWGPLGPTPLHRFLESYRAHSAGAEHELIILFNGVSDDCLPALNAELKGIEHRRLVLTEPLQDLAAYAVAAERLEHEYLCFLNSHSVLLASDWLAKLVLALDQPRVGLAGATGSWASFRSAALNTLFLPSPYRRVFPKRKVARELYRAMELEREAGSQPISELMSRSRFGSLTAVLKGLAPMPEQIRRFESFPAPHLRTNGFIAKRALLRGLGTGEIHTKIDAYSLESGHDSLTHQILRLGLRAIVVARDSSLYEPEHWPQSRTFWQGNQEELLIADNQTRLYANGGLERRRLLSAYAWGQQADPSLPTFLVNAS
jgi:hypothetical protein